jgi:hypothetical protein
VDPIQIAAEVRDQALDRPYTVLQPIPGQSPKPILTVHAYLLDQARAIVAAKVAGETIVVAVTLRHTSPLCVAFDGAAQ